MLILLQCGIKSQTVQLETYPVVSNESESQGDPIVIKKYANRRLYNTDTSSYVTLDDLAEMVRAERDFSVHDAKTGEDLTHAVLTQIIVDQESKGQNLLPIGFLRQLIRFYGDSIERLVPSYLEFSLDKLTSQQDQYRKQMEDAFGVLPFDAVKDQARMNFAMFEKAMGMFKPFNTAMGNAEAANQDDKSETGKGGAAADAGAKSKGKPGDIEALKAEMTAMQNKLDQLSKNTS
ncbi:PHB/PHA accumulation regulator DNA-binding domain protein [bacterium BMS3Bbin10]|nr:PHB/PHA accumulation regulator DNA-binding domain protein [bacterium BMS3Bbin10]